MTAYKTMTLPSEERRPFKNFSEAGTSSSEQVSMNVRGSRLLKILFCIITR